MIISYPDTIEPGKWYDLTCNLKRKPDFSKKILVEYKLQAYNYDFSFKDDKSFKEFEFKPPVPENITWTTKIKYEPKGHWIKEVCDWTYRKHIDYFLKDSNNNIIDRGCLSIKVNRIYLLIGFVLLSTSTGAVVLFVIKKIYKLVCN